MFLKGSLTVEDLLTDTGFCIALPNFFLKDIDRNGYSMYILISSLTK